jgi:hypothetical protein
MPQENLTEIKHVPLGRGNPGKIVNFYAMCMGSNPSQSISPLISIRNAFGL